MTRKGSNKMGYVIQRKPQYGPDYGKTVVLPDINLIRQHRKSQLLDNENLELGNGATVRDFSVSTEEPNVVEYWSLREGDLVEYEMTQSGVKILSVNGEGNPDRVKNWPELAGVNAIRARYPIRAFPLEKYVAEEEEPNFLGNEGEGHQDLRVLTALAPIGFGHCVYVAAPGDSGKTTELRAVFRAGAMLTEEIPDLLVIYANIGERDQDLTDYTEDLRAIVKKHPGVNLNRVEIFGSPETDPEVYFNTEESAGIPWMQMAEWVISHARRMTQRGFHTVLLLDAFSRGVDAHSVEEQKKIRSPGMMRQGLSVTSKDWGRGLLSVKGYFIDDRHKGDGKHRSLTTFPAVLLGGKDGETAESIFAMQTMNSTSTAKWVLTDANINYPKADVFRSGSRRVDRFAGPLQLLDMESARTAVMGGSPDGKPPRGYAAHANLLEYCLIKHPKPLYLSEIDAQIRDFKNPDFLNALTSAGVVLA